MIIDILANDGSPLGVSEETIWGDDLRVGVGGSELAILTLCAEWAERGHDVRFYNDAMNPTGSSFEHRVRTSFNPCENRDVLIVFRSPNPNAINANGLKVWLSHDQHTVGDFRAFAPNVDKIVVISEFHAKFFKDTYGIENTTVIDIPVRLKDYEGRNIEKIPNRLLFSSVPDRGLENVCRMWERIQQRLPETHMVITSDYRLWGSAANNQHYRTGWIKHNNFSFLGAISRKRLVEEELKADILFYPSNYDELFCISVAEAQVAGAYPVTSSTGALETTNMGKKLKLDANDTRNDGHFISALEEILEDRYVLELKRHELQNEAIRRFAPDVVLKQWDERIFK